MTDNLQDSRRDNEETVVEEQAVVDPDFGEEKAPEPTWFRPTGRHSGLGSDRAERVMRNRHSVTRQHENVIQPVNNSNGGGVRFSTVLFVALILVLLGALALATGFVRFSGNQLTVQGADLGGAFAAQNAQVPETGLGENATTDCDTGVLEFSAPNMESGQLYGAAPIGPAGVPILVEAWGPDSTGEDIRLLFTVRANTAIWISNIRGGSGWRICDTSDQMILDRMNRHYTTMQQRDGEMTTVLGILPDNVDHFGHFISETQDGFTVTQDIAAFFARWDNSNTTPIPGAAQGATGACERTGNGVNVRSGPGTVYNVLTTLASGGKFMATHQNVDNGLWYYGSYNDVLGWVSASVTGSSGNCSNLPNMFAPPMNHVAETSIPGNVGGGDSASPAASAVCPQGGVGEAVGPAILETQIDGGWNAVKLNAGSQYTMTGGNCWTMSSQAALDSRFPDHAATYNANNPGTGQVTR